MKRDVRSWKPENPSLWLLGRRSWEDPQCPESNHLPAESHWPYLNHCRSHLKGRKYFKLLRNEQKMREDERRWEKTSSYCTFIKWSSVFWRQSSHYRWLHGHVAVSVITAGKCKSFVVNNSPCSIKLKSRQYIVINLLDTLMNELPCLGLHHDISIVSIFSQCTEVEGFSSSAQEVQQVAKTTVFSYN